MALKKFSLESSRLWLKQNAGYLKRVLKIMGFTLIGIGLTLLVIVAVVASYTSGQLDACSSTLRMSQATIPLGLYCEFGDDGYLYIKSMRMNGQPLYNVDTGMYIYQPERRPPMLRPRGNGQSI